MRSALAVAWIIAGAGAACSTDDDSGGAFAAIDQLDAVYHASACTHFVTCGEFPDLATCLFANTGGFPLELDASGTNDDVVAAVLAGTVIYNGNLMQACIDALTTQTCDRTDEDGRVTPAICGRTLRGTVAGGAACHLDSECVSQQCGKAPCEAMCCAGTCVGDTPPITSPIQLGQSCVGSVPCVAGAYCSPSTEACEPLSQAGSPCVDDQQCDFGLGCSIDQICAPLPMLGEPCVTECRDEGAVCMGMCVPVGLDGAPCTSSADCSPFYQCDPVSETCAETARIGESCSSGSCFDVDAICDPDTTTCVELLDDGAACSDGPECKSGECDALLGTCDAVTPCI